MIVDVGPARPEWLRSMREAAGADAFGQLEGLARALRGRRVAMVNSTATGGGVAEILHRLVRLLNGLGVAIISTSKGIMTDSQARQQGVGGEVLCIVA